MKFCPHIPITWKKPLRNSTRAQPTKKYPYYFRAMCESRYGRIFRTNWALEGFMGLTDLRSTEPYVKTDWRD
jgi:hypothetical protein